MDDIKNIDLYALFGVSVAAKTKEIKTAYRKKALECHPDKNPDNPQAVKLFHQLKKALDILLDESQRSAYDKVLKAREANRIRNEALDSHRKKLKADLEERERRAASQPAEDAMQKAKLERLRKQTFEELEAEVQRIYQERAERANEKILSYQRVNIRWKADNNDASNGGYNLETLTKIFSKYGEIEALVVSSKKKGRALLEFKSAEAARRAQIFEIGNKSNPLSVKILGKDPTDFIYMRNAKRSNSEKSPVFSQCSSTSRTNSNDSSLNFNEFKTMVQQRMKEAQARKNQLAADIDDNQADDEIK